MPLNRPTASASDLCDRLRAALDNGTVRSDPAARLVYARDASHLTLGSPLAVVLPADAGEAAAAVGLCAEAGVPVVCRGTGTGLSGGAVPHDGEVVLALARLTDLGAVDPVARRVNAGPGVLNEQVSRHTRPAGLHFAPDPSSQAAASIGGNVAENAGGPHCLRHGVTLQHLRRLDWIDAAGRPWSTGRGAPLERGIDLVALLCGSEGTLGVVTAAELGLLPVPAAEATLLAVFPRLDDATAAVIRLLGAGLLPVAVEMVDRAMLQAVEAAFAFGFPTDVDAVMIAEFAGTPGEVDEDGQRAANLLGQAGAREVRLAADRAERLALWRCRKQAFGAVGRLAPGYVTMDVVVPLGSLPRLVQDIQVIKAEHGVEVATAFHAGDGNLHPGVHYDDRDPDQARRAHAAADAIIRRALELGGSATGEHGVGVEKLHALPWQLDAEAARLMAGVKACWDPDNLLNPGKALPETDGEWAAAPPVPTEVRFAWDDMTVTVPAGADLAAVQAEALTRRLWIPLGAVADRAPAGPGLGRAGTVAEACALGTTGPLLVGGNPLRDLLLEAWAEDGRGCAFHAGAPVFKNVAGYDLVHLLAGSGGILARLRGATFKLRPAPDELACWRWRGDVDAAWPAVRRVLAARGPVAGAPVAVVDREAEGLAVLAAGRDRVWDLDALAADLAVATAPLEATEVLRVPFTEAPSWLQDAELPAWTGAAADWTVLTAADGGPCPLPVPAGRWIWQELPQVVWTPEALTASSGIHTDGVWRDGAPTELPPPATGVPRDLLRRLKHLFDPDGALPVPAWLAGEESGRDV